MKNKKLPMFVLGALLLGAGGSIAVQTFAQTPAPVQPTAVVSNQADQTIDQKDAQGNDVEKNDANETQESSKVTTPVTVTEAQATQIALTANPGTTVTKTDLEQHHGNAVYEITLSNQVEVKIDANKGTVLPSHKEGLDEKDGKPDAKDANGNDTEENDGSDGQ
jgi:uncharacterized membrane protein YkoI